MDTILYKKYKIFKGSFDHRQFGLYALDFEVSAPDKIHLHHLNR